jgi:O-antigen ligase
MLHIEPPLLAVIVAVYWHPMDERRMWVLLLFLPPMLGRLILYRRLWVYTPLSVVLVIFLLLCAINTQIALSNPLAPPYSWGWYIMMRPLMGVGLALTIPSIAAERRKIDAPLLVAVLLAILVGILGLGSAQYMEKSTQLMFLIDHLPTIRGFPGAEGGFNVNEIGGAMAFFAPLVAGIAIYDWQNGSRTRATLFRRAAATVAFLLLMLALFFGQSRFALFGVIAALGGLIFLLIPAGRWRRVALAALVIFTCVEIVILSKIFEPPTSTLAERDVDSLAVRFEIWGAGLSMVRDHPLTGVGLNKYRGREVRIDYPVPNFSMNVVPHAHNEVLQIGTDAGIPGILLYIGWHATLGWMLLRAWQRGDPFLKAAAASVAAGLAAHAFFGLADAITLFDRFIWAYWLLVGLGGGIYVLACRESDPTTRA